MFHDISFLQARKFGTKQLDEDGLFDLIKKLPGKKSKFEVESTAAVKVSIVSCLFSVLTYSSILNDLNDEINFNTSELMDSRP